MSRMQRCPAVDTWFQEPRFQSQQAVLRSVDQSAALLLVAAGDDPPEFPDEVLSAWRNQLNRQRLMLAQSEAAFIKTAQARAWPQQRIESEPGCLDAEARLAELEQQAADRHPQRRPELYSS